MNDRLSCPSLSLRVCSNSYPLRRWGHPIISFSVNPFSSFPQSFPASASFPISQLFTSGSQTIGASALPSFLPTNIQGWFHLGLTGLVSLMAKGLSYEFSNTTVWKHRFFIVQSSWWSNLSNPSMTTGKTIVLTIWTFAGKVMSLFFSTLSRFVIAFLPRSSHLLMSWLQSPSRNELSSH